jgi:hypothetical protein
MPSAHVRCHLATSDRVEADQRPNKSTVSNCSTSPTRSTIVHRLAISGSSDTPIDFTSQIVSNRFSRWTHPISLSKLVSHA